MADEVNPIKTFQIGLEWFSERGGGLDRYYHDLVIMGHGTAVSINGMVAGYGAAECESTNRIVSFTSPEGPLQRRLADARRAAIRGIEAHCPDVVVSHFALHALPALDRIDRPFVVHFHGPWAAEANVQHGGRRLERSVQHWVERRVYRRADRVIVLSHAFAQLLESNYGVPEKRIAVVPGSIRVERFDLPGVSRAAARASLGWPSSRQIVLTVRRLVRRMGLERLIDAMVEIVPRHPDLLLLIAGKGPEEGALTEQIAALGLSSHVRLLGFLPDKALPLSYRAANVSIVPTTELEGFGLIAAESLAAGTPVLVTPIGGLPEVVAPLSSKLVLPGATTGALIEGLRDWASGKIVTPDSDECREYAQRTFSWEKGTLRLAAEYGRVLA